MYCSVADPVSRPWSVTRTAYPKATTNLGLVEKMNRPNGRDVPSAWSFPHIIALEDTAAQNVHDQGRVQAIFLRWHNIPQLM